MIPETILGVAGDVHAPSANTAAIVTYAAESLLSHAITGVSWSYAGGTPTGGNIKIEFGATTVFTADISAAGQNSISFEPAKRAARNVAVTITLAAGGDGVTGKVSVLGHWKLDS